MWGGGSSKQWEGGHWLEFLDGASWDGLVERVILSKDLETYDFLGKNILSRRKRKRRALETRVYWSLQRHMEA